MNMSEYSDDANDGELALFLNEIRAEATFTRRQISSDVNRKSVLLLPGETRIDLYSVRKMVRLHNEMVQLLRDFLALHPENTRLTSRARRFTKNTG